MSNNRVDFLTPVGRLVSGDCFEAQTLDSEGKPLVIKSGPNAGQPTQRYFLAIAIPKTDATFNELYGKMMQVAKQGSPRLFNDAGECILPTFAWKYEDGDSQVPNMKGTRNCDREGYPGHWIVKMQSSFAPKCYTAGGASVITDPEAIKRGYFIRVYGNVVDNASQQKPGIILNPNMVELVAYGEVLSSGPDGATIFGGAPAASLPPGASATPLAPTTTIAQPSPVATAPAPAISTPNPVSAPAFVAAAVAQPAAAVPVTAAPDFLNPPTPAAATPPPPAPAAGIVEKFETNGAAYTREQLLGYGWNDAQIDALPRTVAF